MFLSEIKSSKQIIKQKQPKILVPWGMNNPEEETYKCSGKPLLSLMLPFMWSLTISVILLAPSVLSFSPMLSRRWFLLLVNFKEKMEMHILASHPAPCPAAFFFFLFVFMAQRVPCGLFFHVIKSPSAGPQAERPEVA